MRGIVSVSAVLGGWLCFSSAAGAWEYTYGPPADADFASRRLTPVTLCPGGGYIAVGTQMFTPGTGDDVKVVRADASGSPLWEASYDVQSLGLPDLGVAIAEVPFGFVFLSDTFFGGVPATALTYIDCSGSVQWSQVYVPGAGALMGLDLIRTQTQVGGGRFELAVAGSWTDGSGGRDGFLMRADANGNLIWGWVYDTGGDEAFNAVTETPPAAGWPWPSAVWDLVAVGGHFDPLSGDRQGLVARLEGGTGSGPGSCMALHGLSKSADTYVSVAALTQPPFAGELAMTGVSVDSSGNEDVWIVRGDPCRLLAEARLGDSGGATQEGGYDLVEITNPTLPGSQPGDLAIAGYHLGPFPLFLDATLLLVEPFQLSPLWAGLFGGPGDELFVTVAEQRTGFVMAGQTSSDWQGNGDPLSFYLVTADPAVPGCESGWRPNLNPATEPETPLGGWYQHMVWEVPVTVAAANLSNPWLVCP